MFENVHPRQITWGLHTANHSIVSLPPDLLPPVCGAPRHPGAVLLMHAVHAEQMGSLKLLVKMGASLNVQSRDGQTALAMAAHQVTHGGGGQWGGGREGGRRRWRWPLIR